MNRRRMHILSAVFVAGALAVTGCSSQARDAIENDTRTAISDASQNGAEVIARNVATSQGGQAFADSGHPLSGDLSCEAVADGKLSEVAINCTGMTVAGEAAVLTGRASELPGLSVVELNGSFSGTVNGIEVFNTGRLGG